MVVKCDHAGERCSRAVVEVNVMMVHPEVKTVSAIIARRSRAIILPSQTVEGVRDVHLL
jgi:hypothetical protein